MFQMEVIYKQNFQNLNNKKREHIINIKQCNENKTENKKFIKQLAMFTFRLLQH